MINNDPNIRPDSSQWVFPTTLAIGGLITFIDSKRSKPFSNYGSPSKGWDRDSDETMKRIGIPLWVGALIFMVWAGVLVLVIILKDVAEVENEYLDIFETMYRIGSIIFGGGQVVVRTPNTIERISVAKADVSAHISPLSIHKCPCSFVILASHVAR